MLSDRSAGQGSHNDAAANSAARGVCQRQRALLIFFAPGHYYRHYYPTVNLTVSCCPQSLSSGTVSNAWAMAQTRCHHGAKTFCSTVHEKDACRAQRPQVVVSFVQARQQTLSSRFVEASLSGGELSMVQRLQPPQGMPVPSCTCVTGLVYRTNSEVTCICSHRIQLEMPKFSRDQE